MRSPQLLSSTIFPVFSCKNWNNPDTKSKIHIQFHPFVSQQIRSLSYRTINYKVALTLNHVAKHIYKILCIYYTKASNKNKY